MPVDFDIPAGDAAATLSEFVRQSQIPTVFFYEFTEGVRTGAVRGRMKPFDALERMIAGTDIEYEFLRTLTFRRRPLPRQPLPRTSSRVKRHPIDRRTPDADIEQVTIVSSSEGDRRLSGAGIFSLHRADIDATGFATVQSLIRTLPQVFGGGPTEDTQQVGLEARTNTAKGTGINLRGLGAGATLVLMNGRRLPLSGSEGLFVDVSNLPLAAVERIEILPDSASTYYGADSAGGLVNFVMRDGFDGCETEMRHGVATKGRMNESSISQLCGEEGPGSRGMIAFDFHSRDALPASSRTQSRSDLTMFGGSNFDTAESNPGNIVLGTQTWAIPRSQNGTGLTPFHFNPGTRNLQNRYEAVDLLPSQQRYTFFGTERLEWSDSVAVFYDVLVGERKTRELKGGQPATILVQPSNPYYVNPTGGSGPVAVSYNFLKDLGPQVSSAAVTSASALSGLEYRWQSGVTLTATMGSASEKMKVTNTNQVDRSALEFALSESDPGQALNVFGDGSHTAPGVLAALRADSRFDTRSALASGAIKVAGPLASIAGREVLTTFGVEARRQKFESTADTDTIAAQRILANRSREIQSAFAEVAIPLVSPQGRVAGIRSLDLSLAGRYETYSDVGRTLAARYGLAWSPSRELSLRGTYSESFRPPGLLDLDESANFHFLVSLPAPPPEVGFSTALIWVGKNSELREENARTWTAELVFEPSSSDATLALTYFDTRFTDRLSQPQPTMGILSDPALTSLVTHDPSSDNLNEVCGRAPFASGFNFCNSRQVAIDAIVDLRTRNDAVTQTSGLDVLARCAHRTDYGRLSFGLNGTYTFEFSEARSPQFPLRNMVNTPSYPISLRMRGAFGWEAGAIDVSGFVDYVNSYMDTVSVPRRRVSSWTTLSLQATYKLPTTSVSLGVDNLLDTPPPFLNNTVGIGYDQENGDLTGRVVSLTLRKHW